MRYQYKFINADSERDLESKLNDAGSEGWRLDAFDVHDSSRVSYRYNAVMVRETQPHDAAYGGPS